MSFVKELGIYGYKRKCLGTLGGEGEEGVISAEHLQGKKTDMFSNREMEERYYIQKKQHLQKYEDILRIAKHFCKLENKTLDLQLCGIEGKVMKQKNRKFGVHNERSCVIYDIESIFWMCSCAEC